MIADRWKLNVVPEDRHKIWQKVGARVCIQLNMPHWFEDDEFVSWLDSHDSGEIATWHTHVPGFATEYSDIFMWRCGREGSNSDMPPRFWKEVLEATKGYEECLIWITNLQELEL